METKSQAVQHIDKKDNKSMTGKYFQKWDPSTDS